MPYSTIESADPPPIKARVFHQHRPFSPLNVPNEPLTTPYSNSQGADKADPCIEEADGCLRYQSSSALRNLVGVVAAKVRKARLNALSD